MSAAPGPELRDLAAALVGAGPRFALVGGLAVSVRAEPRFTRDIDVALAVDSDAEAEAALHTLRAGGYAPFALVEQTGTGRLGTARLRTPSGGIADLLFAVTGIEATIVAHATELFVAPGVALPVATASHLAAMKVLSAVPARPTDAADLRALWLEGLDLAAVEQALTQITAAGCNRGEDLSAKWRRLRSELGLTP